MAIQTTLTNPSTGESIVCSAWQGQVSRLKAAGEVYHRLGRTGAGTQSVGLRADPSQCRAFVVCAAASTAATVRDTFHRLALETRVGMTDDFGASLRVCVHTVRAVIQAGRFGYGGVSYPYCVVADIVLEDVGTDPSASSTDANGTGGSYNFNDTAGNGVI